jgi:hypothetical protein
MSSFHFWFPRLARMACVTALLLASGGCDGAAPPAPDGPDTSVPADATPTPPDTATPEDTPRPPADLPRLPDATPPADTPADASDANLTVSPLAVAKGCAPRGHFFGTQVEVGFTWGTNLPAVCTLCRSVTEGAEACYDPSEAAPQTHHSGYDRITDYFFFDGPPAVDTRITWRARCTAGRTTVYSPPHTVTLDADDVACIWFYDAACGDGTGMGCRAILPQCAEGRVMAVQDRCTRCVFPATCDCGDGTLATCPGHESIACGPGEQRAIQDGCPVCVDPRTCAPPCAPNCPREVGATAACPFQYREPLAPRCVAAHCREGACATDADCAAPRGTVGGTRCVLGSCVFCWNDSQVDDGLLCRAGRPVAPPLACPPPPPCDALGCALVTPSENPCPVCVCDLYGKPCAADEECLVYSSHPYSRCVYGRCVDCRDDADCGRHMNPPGRCAPPGVCLTAPFDISTLFGTWLIGWHGGLDHLSYFRFEPDGTFRRARYEASGAFADSIGRPECFAGDTPPSPLVGTWRADTDDEGRALVHLALNADCAPDAGWQATFVADPFAAGGALFHYPDIGSLSAYRVPAERCSPDFALCAPPRPEDFGW